MNVRIASCLAALLALAGCAETALVCSEPGFVLDDQGRCRPESDLPDGGRDGGQDGGVDAGTDSGPPDAGPCGVCDGHTPFCAQVSDGVFECVECVDDPQCGDGFCVENQCVECRGHDDCSDPAAAQCDATGSCVPCTVDSQCVGTPAGPDGICDTDRTPATCVECLSTAQCPTNESCNLLTGTCVPVVRFSQRTCAPCTNDDQCADDPWESRCVPMTFGEAFHGYYCLPEATAMACPQPYRGAGITVPRTSIGGDGPRTYCAINESVTTCEAVLALVDERTCGADGTAPTCPLGGLCRTLPGLGNRCTYQCGAPSQCLDMATRAEWTCGAGGGAAPTYCGG
jgi:hypothetical protein